LIDVAYEGDFGVGQGEEAVDVGHAAAVGAHDSDADPFVGAVGGAQQPGLAECGEGDGAEGGLLDEASSGEG
jgi:hypothetical protein